MFSQGTFDEMMDHVQPKEGLLNKVHNGGFNHKFMDDHNSKVHPIVMKNEEGLISHFTKKWCAKVGIGKNDVEWVM